MRYTQQEMAAKGGAHIPMSHKAVKEVAKLRQLLQEERKLSLRSKETTDAKLAAANKKTASFQRQLQNLTQPKHAKRAPDPHKPELHSIKEGGMTSEESDETKLNGVLKIVFLYFLAILNASACQENGVHAFLYKFHKFLFFQIPFRI